MTPQVALIPDSVYGALLLSVIDFFLSFLAISVIGFVLAFFPYLNRTALQAPPVSVSVMPARDESAELVAAIAAAIYTIRPEKGLKPTQPYERCSRLSHNRGAVLQYRSV